MNKLSLIKSIASAAGLYFLCVGIAVGIDLGIFRVTNMAHTPAIAALLAGGVYLSVVRKTKTAGSIIALGTMMSLFFFFSGHFFWSFLPSILCAFLAAVIARYGQYQNISWLVASYAIFSLGNLAPIFTMWIAPKAYVAQLLAEGKTQTYVDKVMIPAAPLTILGHFGAIIICALLGSYVFFFLSQRKKSV